MQKWSVERWVAVVSATIAVCSMGINLYWLGDLRTALCRSESALAGLGCKTYRWLVFQQRTMRFSSPMATIPVRSISPSPPGDSTRFALLDKSKSFPRDTLLGRSGSAPGHSARH
jgi:hypothetical protein